MYMLKDINDIEVTNVQILHTTHADKCFSGDGYYHGESPLHTVLSEAKAQNGSTGSSRPRTGDFHLPRGVTVD